MNGYASPTLIEYGDSKNLIEGVCSWGVEGFTLDKTDSWQGGCWQCSWITGCSLHWECEGTCPDSCTDVPDSC